MVFLLPLPQIPINETILVNNDGYYKTQETAILLQALIVLIELVNI
jgi:hypothetical protein